MDFATVAVVITALAGLLTGASALYKGWKDSKSVASQGYVDQNLAIMQRTIDLQALEDTRLRELNDKRIQKIEELEVQIELLTEELEATKKACEECVQKIKTIEKQGTIS